RFALGAGIAFAAVLPGLARGALRALLTIAENDLLRDLVFLELRVAVPVEAGAHPLPPGAARRPGLDRLARQQRRAPIVTCRRPAAVARERTQAAHAHPRSQDQPAPHVSRFEHASSQR